MQGRAAASPGPRVPLRLVPLRLAHDCSNTPEARREALDVEARPEASALLQRTPPSSRTTGGDGEFGTPLIGARPPDSFRGRPPDSVQGREGGCCAGALEGIASLVTVG